MIDQQPDVVAPLAQRRDLDVHDVEAVKQILAELVRRHAIDQPTVGRGDDANVDARRAAIGADALNLAVLEKPQQQRLHLQAHLADFVHEDRAAMRLLEPAPACRDRRR